jgi:hypothetical protein
MSFGFLRSYFHEYNEREIQCLSVGARRFPIDIIFSDDFPQLGWFFSSVNAATATVDNSSSFLSQE